jgi:carbamoyltransferase
VSKVRILGISAYYHDSAAALIEDGRIIAAAQEERFTREKGDSSFPHNAIAFCLDEAGVTEDELDHVVFYENPFVKFERLLTTYHLTAPSSLVSYLKAMPSWLTKNVWLEKEISRQMGIKKRIVFCDHHLSHAASAFFPSPFDEAAILTIDGVGEWSTATHGVGKGNTIELTEEIRFPNSLGLLYSAFTYFTGFKINSGEYKVMGLAPYGKPIYADAIREHIADISDDGALALNQRYFNYMGGLKMTNSRFADLFGGPPRKPETLVTQREMDLAASVQEVVNDVVMKMASHVHRKTGAVNCVLAGGVALNVVATGKLLKDGPFDSIWIQPAAGDAGGALGAALWVWHQVLGKSRKTEPRDSMRGALLGPEIPQRSKSHDRVLESLGGVWETMSEEALQKRVANLIAEEKVIGIARGRMEWGPRALGARSILGDARSPAMQSHMNLAIKFREGFRPFAPMVLREDVSDYFDSEAESPYMLLTFPVKESRRKALTIEEQELWGIDLLKVPRSDIPAVTHVDYSARVQTIDKQRHPFMHGVLREFKSLTGCPVIVNTSFNVRGEPIVMTVGDAYRCFMATEIDCLVVGNRFFMRENQEDRPMDASEREKWLGRFDLD